MDETFKPETKQEAPKGADGDSSEGSEPTAAPQDEEKNALIEGLAKLEEKIDRLERGGQSEAGRVPPAPKVRTPIEMAQDFEDGKLELFEYNK